jgi:hypothetical protein
MAQFTLNWFAAAVIVNPNATGQRALYRQKSIGGAFISTGFTPTNDLPKTAETATSPVVADNIVWEFKVQALCNIGGPVDNDNGIEEAIKFVCLVPIVTKTETTAQAVLNVLNTDITKATFILVRDSDSAVISGPTSVNRVGNSITHNVSSLIGATQYHWEIALFATINGVEVSSAQVGYLNAPCISASFTTDAPVCDPVTSLTVTSIEA